MKGNAWTIARKELARFFSNKASALVSIVLPGLLIFLMWTFMGDAMGGMFKPDMSKPPASGGGCGERARKRESACGGFDRRHAGRAFAARRR